ncbi:terminase gpA endonuclease subunit [Botrimarina hoheduenensis]|uniref:Phage terminase large subunit (GpA) n=1 Tax=Botrimarina hoheduenensis TaxID=2528000 RepID=A0A5C5W8G9_9BACT|nr:terminase gpA endonuclease subunit [Botrimarina hoheduenensis]TWT47188.1 Phage terminase large subunit (GpA) [Botrimarina hoheduenensis]
MATDPRQLRPSELCRYLNSTPLGAVLSERQLHRHRTRAGLRVGNERQVDLLRYTAWLIQMRHEPKPEPAADPYQTLKERARARNATLSTAGRDIGELPAVADPARKAQAASNFQRFCEAYFPQTFHLAWSEDHLKVIRKIEQAVLEGGLFAMAMPRGSGKTSLCECACIWAVLNGHRAFVCLIGSDEGHAMDMLDSIKTELDANDLLLADYPEVVYPIQSLDGIANRCGGQLYRGQRTHIGWTAREIVLPTIPGSSASGAIIKVAGITGRIRGMKYKRADGKTVRPSLVVLDDPQTDESARSVTQCATREGVLAGAVLGLAGPGQKIAGVMPCTVIRPGDMADNLLDRDQHPEWNGERTKMVYAFPDDEKLWREYAELRAEELRAGRGLAAATQFYREHQAAMDEGAQVAWPERFNHDELSALQHAMNLKLQDEAAFFAEYQNEPLPLEAGDAEELSADQIAAKLNRYARGVVPLAAQRLTAFIDVQQNLLYYLVVAWEPNFTGYVLDYGAYPDQQRDYFTLRDARRTLTLAHGGGLEGAIYAGLTALADEILGKEWRREDGALLRIERCLVDANWGSSTEVVYQFCRQSAYASVVTPSHGRFVGASSQPFSEYRRKSGDLLGNNWRIPSANGRRAVRYVLYDTNFWKSFVYARLAVGMGDAGCLSLYGAKPATHRLLAEHLTAEHRVRTEGRGRTVDEWKLRPQRADNHWLDGLVGAAVAASLQGCALEGQPVMSAIRKRRRRRYRAIG